MIKTFKMKLYPGMEEEYERRHNELWPEMIDMIHAHGGRNYTIALDPDTLTLFGYIEIDDPERWAAGADMPSTGSGGTSWPTSWRPTRTTRPFPSTCPCCSTWTRRRERMCEQALRPGHPTA